MNKLQPPVFDNSLLHTPSQKFVYEGHEVEMVMTYRYNDEFQLWNLDTEVYLDNIMVPLWDYIYNDTDFERFHDEMHSLNHDIDEPKGVTFHEDFVELMKQLLDEHIATLNGPTGE